MRFDHYRENTKKYSMKIIYENQFIFAPYAGSLFSSPNFNVKKQILQSEILNLSPFTGTRSSLILVGFSFWKNHSKICNDFQCEKKCLQIDYEQGVANGI